MYMYIYIYINTQTVVKSWKCWGPALTLLGSCRFWSRCKGEAGFADLASAVLRRLYFPSRAPRMQIIPATVEPITGLPTYK